jgi:hypothetical protein
MTEFSHVRSGAGKSGLRLLALLLAPAVSAVGCGTTLIADAVSRQADGWSFTLERLRDGPNSFAVTGNTIYEAESGQRLVWAYFKIRNDADATRVLGYDACDLNLGADKVLPAVVTRYNGVASVLEKNETYPPHDVNYRILIYSYPEGPLPSRIKCADMTFDIPQNVEKAATGMSR